MELQGFGALDRRLALYQAELRGKAERARLVDIGKLAADDIARAVATTPARHGSLSDRSMSRWHARGREPFALTGHYEVDGSTVAIDPAAEGPGWRKGAGPIRVLESGREAYQQGDRRKAGTRTLKRTGERVDKFRTVNRATGATRGKGTWTRAAEQFKAHAGAKYVRLFEHDWHRIARGG